MSDVSDLYSSSQYEGTAPDHFAYPLSDIDPRLVTPELSFSQLSTDSTLNPEFIRPLTIPSSLERVGPKRIKEFILYSKMNKQEFMEWWIQTQSGSELHNEEKEKVKWDGEGFSSDVWQHFHQVAHKTTGEPKVMCKRCGKILAHPQSSGHGTTAMKRHWDKNDACRKSKAAEQASLPSYFQRQVRKA
jgi:hypothetical protein